MILSKSRVVISAQMLIFSLIISSTGIFTNDAVALKPNSGEVEKVSISLEGGFMPYHLTLQNLPILYIYKNKSYQPAPRAAVFPSEALAPIEERLHSSKELKEALAKFVIAINEPNRGWGNPPVADAPGLSLTISFSNSTTNVFVPSWGFNQIQFGVSKEQSEARNRLAKAIEDLSSLRAITTRIYKPSYLQLDLFSADDIYSDPTSSTLSWPSKLPQKPGCYKIRKVLLPKNSKENSIYSVSGKTQYFAVFKALLPGQVSCG